MPVNLNTCEQLNSDFWRIVTPLWRTQKFYYVRMRGKLYEHYNVLVSGMADIFQSH